MGYNRRVKTESMHNQSTSQTPPDGEVTQRLPDPSRTQRIVWTPPNTHLRLTVTPGGGPKPDTQGRRDVLRGVAAVLLTLFLLRSLPLPRARAKTPIVAPALASPLVPRASPAVVFRPLPAPLYWRRTRSDAPVRVFLVPPSVPMPPDE